MSIFITHLLSKVILALLCADVCQPTVYPLEFFTSNGLYSDDDRAIFVMDVFQNDDMAGFRFYNNSKVESIIQTIYFDDDSLLELSEITNLPGTFFDPMSTPLGLPFGGTYVPPFLTTQGFTIDAASLPPLNGVDPSEWATITFELAAGKTIDDLIKELNSKTMRTGVNVISLPDGSSGYATDLPEPSTFMLLALSAAFAFTRRCR